MNRTSQAKEYEQLLLDMRSVEGLILPAKFGTPTDVSLRVVSENDPEEWVTQASCSTACNTCSIARFVGTLCSRPTQVDSCLHWRP